MWTGAQFQNSGYGQIQYQGRPHLAHRIAWFLTNGWPEQNVLHHCDVKLCVRPDHLFSGTLSDNMQDAIAKGRHRPGNTSESASKGEAHHDAKLTVAEVREIRLAYTTEGESQYALARRYGVNAGTINGIVRGRTWRSVVD